jgi:hypothetical protein
MAERKCTPITVGRVRFYPKIPPFHYNERDISSQNKNLGGI